MDHAASVNCAREPDWERYYSGVSRHRNIESLRRATPPDDATFHRVTSATQIPTSS